MSMQARAYLREQNERYNGRDTPRNQLYCALVESCQIISEMDGPKGHRVWSILVDGEVYLRVGASYCPKLKHQLAFKIGDSSITYRTIGVLHSQDSPMSVMYDSAMSVVSVGDDVHEIPIQYTSKGLVGVNEDLQLSLVRAIDIRRRADIEEGKTSS